MSKIDLIELKKGQVTRNHNKSLDNELVDVVYRAVARFLPNFENRKL